MTSKFLPTPSARRATQTGRSPDRGRYFYPRPPRGGRRRPVDLLEADKRFLPTPSARRATLAVRRFFNWDAFLPTPSARRATEELIQAYKAAKISTHALREEGDVEANKIYEVSICISTHALREEGDQTTRPPTVRCPISTHALREEGDPGRKQRGLTRGDFYPRPPRGGRLFLLVDGAHRMEFLPTPSARRATGAKNRRVTCNFISTHALREEGDTRKRRQMEGEVQFLPTPSARRATAVFVRCSYR